MVGLPYDSTKSPVSFAHNAMRQPGATVATVLSSLVPPPMASLPLLTDPSARPGQWVRYTAMVQDVWDTELFVASSPDGQSAILTENAVASSHHAAQLAERLPLYLVSVPGETDWVRGDHRPPANPSAIPVVSLPQSNPSFKLKRTRDDVEMADEAAEAEAAALSASTPIPTSTIPASASRPPPCPARLSRPSLSDKRVKPTSQDSQISSATLPALTIGLNTPDVGAVSASAVVAKLYDVGREGQAVAPALNSVVEVVGVVQDGVDFCATPDDAFAAEVVARNPRNVRRLHVVRWRVVPAHEGNPLVARLGVNAISSARADAAGAAHHLRTLLVRYLASALLGDILAAEYVLLALVARPVRTGAQLLGKLSVNVVLPTCANSNVAPRFLRALRHICSRVVAVDVNIASMNSAEIYPRKDYELNRLKAGRLQLAAGTCLVTDETQLTHGRLAERGVKNIRALASVAQRATAPLDFQYYESEMEMQCSTILLTQRGKSVIGGDVVVRVCENKEVSLPDWESSDADTVEKMRLSLTLLAEYGDFDISQEASDEVANAYVEARKKGLAKDGQESLQRWLSVARCCARSFGEQKLSLERWKYALALEQSREARVVNK